jgi:hypothetical protein
MQGKRAGPFEKNHILGTLSRAGHKTMRLDYSGIRVLCSGVQHSVEKDHENGRDDACDYHHG